MSDFHFIREGDRKLLSLQVFKKTGSVPNLSVTAGSAQAPRWILTEGTGLSAVLSAGSGTGNGRVLRSTKAASGFVFISLNGSLTSGLTPKTYVMGLTMYSADSDGKVLNEYRAGFLVVQGQVR